MLDFVTLVKKHIDSSRFGCTELAGIDRVVLCGTGSVGEKEGCAFKKPYVNPSFSLYIYSKRL